MIGVMNGEVWVMADEINPHHEPVEEVLDKVLKPRRKGKGGKIFHTDEERQRAVDEFARSGDLKAVAKKYGVSGFSIYQWRKKLGASSEAMDAKALEGERKVYSYGCDCGFKFKSAIVPRLIKCPECRARPEEVN